MKNHLLRLFVLSFCTLLVSCNKEYSQTDDVANDDKIEIKGSFYSKASIRREMSKALNVEEKKLIFNPESNDFTHADFNFTYSPEEILNIK